MQTERLSKLQKTILRAASLNPERSIYNQQVVESLYGKGSRAGEAAVARAILSLARRGLVERRAWLYRATRPGHSYCKLTMAGGIVATDC